MEPQRVHSKAGAVPAMLQLYTERALHAAILEQWNLTNKGSSGYTNCKEQLSRMKAGNG